MRSEWATQGPGKESGLGFLISFLSEEISQRELLSAYEAVGEESGDRQTTGSKHPGDQRSCGSDGGLHGRRPERSSRPRRNEEHRRPNPNQARGHSGAALQASSGYACGFRKGSHSTVQCATLIRLPVFERVRRVKYAEPCFRCLKEGHEAESCGVVCELCHGAHHRLCCFGQLSGSNSMGSCSKNVTGVEVVPQVRRVLPRTPVCQTHRHRCHVTLECNKSVLYS